MIKCPFRPKHEIRAVADDFRGRHWDQALPVDMELVLERAGLHLIPIDGLEDLGVDALLRMNRDEIIISKKQYLDERFQRRLQFSLAHEIGHYVLHSRIMRLQKFNYIDEYSQFVRAFPEKDWGYFEYQANEFAGRLLVPLPELYTALEDAAERIRNDPTAIKMYSNDPEQVLSYMSVTMKDRFGVSESVVLYRIKNEGIVPEDISKPIEYPYV